MADCATDNSGTDQPAASGSSRGIKGMLHDDLNDRALLVLRVVLIDLCIVARMAMGLRRACFTKFGGLFALPEAYSFPYVVFCLFAGAYVLLYASGMGCRKTGGRVAGWKDAAQRLLEGEFHTYYPLVLVIIGSCLVLCGAMGLWLDVQQYLVFDQGFLDVSFAGCILLSRGLRLSRVGATGSRLPIDVQGSNQGHQGDVACEG